jgi:hypothetical protein
MKTHFSKQFLAEISNRTIKLINQVSPNYLIKSPKRPVSSQSLEDNSTQDLQFLFYYDFTKDEIYPLIDNVIQKGLYPEKDELICCDFKNWEDYYKTAIEYGYEFDEIYLSNLTLEEKAKIIDKNKLEYSNSFKFKKWLENTENNTDSIYSFLLDFVWDITNQNKKN